MKRLLAILLLFGMLFAVMPAHAAETVIQDGVKVTLITDKDSYEVDEWINAQLDIQNTNSYPIKNIRTSIVAPEGYLLLNGSSAEIAELSAGKSYVYKNSMVAAPEKPVVIPQTGDDSHIGLWVLLASISFAAFCVLAVKSRKAGRMMSMLLCVVLVGTLVPSSVPAKADVITKSIVVTKQITLGGQAAIVKGIVTYDYEVEPATFQVGDFVCTYDETGKGIIILDYVGTAKDITVPAVINGSPVTGIAADAFEGYNGITLHVGAGSVAENYAQTMGIPYVVIGSTTPTPTATPTATIEITPSPTPTPDPSPTASKKPTAISRFEYEFENGKCIITKYLGGLNGDIVVPATIKGYPVTEIASGAFRLQGYYDIESGDVDRFVSSITLPETVTTIGSSAFASQFNLKEVYLPESLESIGNGAFANNYPYADADLAEIHIPANVTSIGTNPFASNVNLKTITVDSRNTIYSVVDGSLINKQTGELITYPNAWDKEGYTIPSEVKVIGAAAFYECELTGVTFPDSVETIGGSAFWGSGLTAVSLPKSLNVIEAYAFYKCENLTEVCIAPNSVQTIEKAAFAYCSNLTKVYIPASVESIAIGCFDVDSKGNTNEDLLIYGVAGSYAEAYANKYGITFRAIGEGQFPTPVPVIPEAPTPTPTTPGVIGPCDGVNHIMAKITSEEVHPHQLKSICICGEETLLPNVGTNTSCCECVGHSWSEVINTDLGYLQNCTRCSAQIFVTPSKGQFMGDLFNEYRQTSLNDLFERTALNATQKMTEAGFVYINETINATSDVVGSTIDATIDIINGKEPKEKTMIAEWEHLITQMLVSDFADGEVNNAEQSLLDGIDTLETVKQGLSQVEYLYQLAEECLIEGKITSNREQNNKYISMIWENAEGKLTEIEIEWLQKLMNNNEVLDQISTAMDKVEKAMSKADKLLKGLTFVAEGIKEYEKENLYAQIALFYDEQMRKLDHLENAANWIGCASLITAIDNVRVRIDEQMENSFAHVLNAVGEVTKDYFVKELKSAVSKKISTALSKAAPAVAVIEIIGKSADWLLDWDSAYQKGFELQTLGLMNNTIRSEVADVFNEDIDAAYYLSELYTVLQIQGMDCTLRYLEAYDTARGLSVEEFGIDNMKDVRTTVESKITQLTEAQKNMNGVYYAYWVSTAQ